MYRKLICGLFVFLTATAISTTPAVSARIKCWTNNEGVRECGNAVPPEYSQKGHRVLSEHGVVVQERKRAKTKEEIEEQWRLAKAQQEKERLAREQASRDRVLVDTFSSEDDLIMARDGKLSVIESHIKLTQNHIEKLQSNLEQFIAAAADMERRGEQPSEKVLNDINSVRRQIAENRAAIQARRKEQESIRKKFAADLKRFRELTAK